MNHPRRRTETRCPGCRKMVPVTARFCPACGRPLRSADGVSPHPGRTRHPEPLAPPAGFQAVKDSADLYYRSEPVGGGQVLSGTEPLDVHLFNAGYALEGVLLTLRGWDKAGRPSLKEDWELESWRRGETIMRDIPSWAISEPLKRVELSLARCAFASEG